MKRRFRVLVALVMGTLPGAWPVIGTAQAPAAPSGSVPRDSLLSCAVGLATSAGFRVTPGGRPNRIGLARPRDTGGATYPVDALRLMLAPPDSTGTVRLTIDIKVFVVSRTTGLNQAEMDPAPALTALADSMRLRCRERPR